MSAPFQDFSGIAARFTGTNVNTDAIIPAAWLRTAHADFGRGLFARWRYDDAGNEIPTFVLNQEPFRRARILVADENFGCGSSREAAVWALMQFGIRCVLAPELRRHLLRERLPQRTAGRPHRAGGPGRPRCGHLRPCAQPGLRGLPVRTTITGPDGTSHHFDVPRSRAQALLRGDDEIAITLSHLADIEDFPQALAAIPALAASRPRNGMAIRMSMPAACAASRRPIPVTQNTSANQQLGSDANAET